MSNEFPWQEAANRLPGDLLDTEETEIPIEQWQDDDTGVSVHLYWPLYDIPTALWVQLGQIEENLRGEQVYDYLTAVPLADAYALREMLDLLITRAEELLTNTPRL